MKLVGSMMVAEGELGRYIEPCVESMLSYCDEIRAVVDTDCDSKVRQWMSKHATVLCSPTISFYGHEGKARQRLLDWTLEADPTHVITLDCDEFVTDGQALRDALSQNGNVWRMSLEEVWQARPDGIRVRVDGGWGVGSSTVWKVPEASQRRQLQILDRALACGRDPVSIRALGSRFPTLPVDATILHFGWAKESERASRYQRYIDHDSGQFHARAHLESIMWPDNRVSLIEHSWPEGLKDQKDRILDYASKT